MRCGVSTSAGDAKVAHPIAWEVAHTVTVDGAYGRDHDASRAMSPQAGIYLLHRRYFALQRMISMQAITVRNRDAGIGGLASDGTALSSRR